MEKSDIPAEIIATIRNDLRRAVAPLLDSHNRWVGVMGHSLELADHLQVRLQTRWPRARVRRLGGGESLAGLWLVWASPADAEAITGRLQQSSPLAHLMVVGPRRPNATYHQPAHGVLDSETAISRAVELMVVLADVRRLSAPPLIERLVAARLAEQYSYGAIRRAGLTPPPPPPSLAEAERAALQRADRAANGNRTRAAELFGVSRRHFYRLMKQYGIE